MRPRRPSPSPDEVMPERLRWENRPAFDDRDAYNAWLDEHKQWYEDRGVSLLDVLRGKAGFGEAS